MVTYVLARTMRNQASCRCGWQGKRRLFRGHAVVDAYQHCAESGHKPLGAPDICVTAPPVIRDTTA